MGVLSRDAPGAVPRRPDITFSQDEPYTFYKLDDLHVVVAGLNSTMPEIHGDEEEHKTIKASTGPPPSAYEKLIREARMATSAVRRKATATVRRPLETAGALGWLRIGIVHHNPVRNRPTTMRTYMAPRFSSRFSGLP